MDLDPFLMSVPRPIQECDVPFLANLNIVNLGILITDEAAATPSADGTLPARRRLASALRWLREV